MGNALNSRLASLLAAVRSEFGGDVRVTLEPADAAPAGPAPVLTIKRMAIDQTEERICVGIVLEPTKELGTPDSQGDIYSAEEVRQAAYAYMEKSQQIGVQHTDSADGKIKILESWIQRSDATIDGQSVAQGTWLMGIRVVDDELWKACKAGRFTGFSIGGVADSTPVI